MMCKERNSRKTLVNLMILAFSRKVFLSSMALCLTRIKGV